MSLPRASRDRPLAAPARWNGFPSYSQITALFTAEGRFLGACACLYAIITLAAAANLNRYFGQTWDVLTFVQAARTFLDGTWTALYAVSRAGQTWPFAYPPLHALVVAPWIALPLPAHLMARVPPVLADLGVGLALYRIVASLTEGTGASYVPRPSTRLPRAAFVLWLFNPVTFYDTAVQGHFEAEWLLPVLLAYWLTARKRNPVWPALAMAVAILFKQVAILWALPLWAFELRRAFDRENSWRRAIRAPLVSMGVVGALFVLVSLPFLLYSSDYVYMNLTYVAGVPLQTVSWLVVLAAWLGVNAPVLALGTPVLFASAAVISGLLFARGPAAAERLYVAGTLIALALFLTSKKVMGYYYVMLLPFLLVALLRFRRFSLLAPVLGVTTLVSLAPYYAPDFVERSHLPLYAWLGVGASLSFVFLFWQIWHMEEKHGFERSVEGAAEGSETGHADPALRTARVIGPALWAGSALAALAQPLVGSMTSPLRAPLVAPGAEAAVWTAAGVVAGGALVVTAALVRLYRAPLAVAFWPAALLPLYFLVYTLTKESTAALEIWLKSAGL